MALYGLVIGNGHKPGTFAFRRNKRDALRDAKQTGARVYIMRREPSAGAWDAPTFIMVADGLIANFGKQEK